MKSFWCRLTAGSESGWVGSPAPELHEGIRVLYRGFIANRAHLLREARARGETLDDPSDGLLFARAYRYWGDELSSQVVGEYSVVLVDRPGRRAMLAHDALGLLPLYIVRMTDGLAVASHLDLLVRNTGIGELDEEYLADYVANGCSVGEHTPYRHIRMLVPGRVATLAEGKVVERRIWDWGRVPDVRLQGDGEYEERFRNLLQEAVRSALRSDGAAWCELSGGLDSSSIVSMAARSNAKGLAALSLVFDRSKTADERHWMASVVDRYPIPWHTLDGDDAPPFPTGSDEFYAEPGALARRSNFFRAREALFRRHNVQVLLSGFGGDQVLFGPGTRPLHLADHLWRGRPHQALSGMRAWRRADPDRRGGLYWLMHGLVGPAMTRLFGRMPVEESLPTAPWIRDDYARRWDLPGRGLQSWEGTPQGAANRAFAKRVWDACMIAAKRSDTVRSCEVRYPLLYRPLVEFLFAIPPDQQMRPGETRSLQRRALRGILPEAIRRRQGKGATDESIWRMLMARPAWCRALTERPRIVQRGLADGRLWAQAIAQARCGGIHLSYLFFRMVALEMWLRQIEGVELERSHSVPCWV